MGLLQKTCLGCIKLMINITNLKSGSNLDLHVNINKKTRGSQEPVIAHLVFNLTSKVDRKWECHT